MIHLNVVFLVVEHISDQQLIVQQVRRYSRVLVCMQSWGNLVTCNLSYVIFITFQVKSNITKLLFSQVICNLIILLSEVILLLYILHM